MINRQPLLKKFLSFSIGSWVTLLLSLITTPILTRILTPAEFGSMSLILLSVNLIVILSLSGLDQSYMRYYYESQVISKASILRIGIFFSVLMAFILLFLIYLSKEYSLPLLLGNSDTYLFFLFSVIVLLSVVNRFNYVLLRMDQKAKLYSTLQVVQKLVDFIMFLMIYFLLLTDWNKIYIAIVAYAISVFALFILGGIFNRKHYLNTFSLKTDRLMNLKEIKLLLIYGVPLSITILITWVFQYIDRLMLNHYTNLTEVGIYAAAFKVIAIINIIQVSFSTFWTPISNQRYNENKNDKLFFEKMFNRVLYSLVIIGVLILMCKDVLVLFFGEAYQGAIELVPYLILIPIMYTLSEITVVGINFKKKTQYHIYISLLVCCINVVGNFVLIPVYGAEGAAFSTGVSYVLYFLLRTFSGMKFYYFKVFNLKNIVILLAFVLLCLVI